MSIHKTLQSKIFVCSYAHFFCEKHHYIYKAGDSRATLHWFRLYLKQELGEFISSVDQRVSDNTVGSMYKYIYIVFTYFSNII